MWLPKVIIAKQLSALWYFIQGCSVDTVALCTDTEPRSMGIFYSKFLEVVSEAQEKENEQLQLGGAGIEVEAEMLGCWEIKVEVSCRSELRLKFRAVGMWS